MFPNINHIFIALSFAYSIYFYSSPKKHTKFVVAVVYQHIMNPLSRGFQSWVMDRVTWRGFFRRLPPTENVEENHLDFREHVFVWKGKAKSLSTPKTLKYVQKKNMFHPILSHKLAFKTKKHIHHECLLVLRQVGPLEIPSSLTPFPPPY